LDDLSVDYTVDERIVDLDDPARLVSAVAREGATMIVIGTRRRGGLRSALLGSSSIRGIRNRRQMHARTHWICSAARDDR
jgi:nucleotide-binding universal stress UspA family protein